MNPVCFLLRQESPIQKSATPQGLPPPTQQIKIQMQTSWVGRSTRGQGTVHWIQDNFVFGQNSKSLLVFRNGPVRSFGTFYATFEKQNGDFLIPSVKKVDLKNRKNEKMAQNGQFWAYFGVFEWLNLFRPNFAPAVKLYFLSFLRIMMGGNLKSPAITRNKIFCVKNVAFLPNHKVFWVKMYLKSNIRHTIDWNYFEILNSHLYFLTRIKKK